MNNELSMNSFFILGNHNLQSKCQIAHLLVHECLAIPEPNVSEADWLQANGRPLQLRLQHVMLLQGPGRALGMQGGAGRMMGDLYTMEIWQNAVTLISAYFQIGPVSLFIPLLRSLYWRILCFFSASGLTCSASERQPRSARRSHSYVSPSNGLNGFVGRDPNVE
jgi:hypothetical protein